MQVWVTQEPRRVIRCHGAGVTAGWGPLGVSTGRRKLIGISPTASNMPTFSPLINLLPETHELFVTDKLLGKALDENVIKSEDALSVFTELFSDSF